jgi:hypothetical protein
VINQFAQKLDAKIPVDFFLLPVDFELTNRFSQSEILQVVYQTDKFRLYTWK